MQIASSPRFGAPLPVFRSFLLPLAVLLLAAAPPSRADTAYANGFQFFQAQQQTPVWCWAACIQMILNYKGVNWSQTDVVRSIKHGLSVSTATNQQMANFLSGWGFTTDGSRWQGRCACYPGAPRTDWLVNELMNDRPVIISYVSGPQMSHVVVLHQVDFTPAYPLPIINSGVVFDPYTGQNRAVSGPSLGRDITSHFFAWIVKQP